jgi:1,2-diacylglycerol 3-beta-galactosyltransferase
MAKKVLIFYSKTGGGHFRCAEAIADRLKKDSSDVEITLIDGLEKTVAGDIKPDKIFLLFSTNLVFLYNFLYNALDNHFGVFLLRFLAKLQWGYRLKEKIDKVKPDLIVSTHPAISKETIAGKVPSPFITVCTDLGHPHLLWLSPSSDTVIVANQDLEHYALKREKKLKETVVNLGYPLKEEFMGREKSAALSQQILVLGGGAGSGNIEKQIDFLAKSFPDKQFLAVCGINKGALEEITSHNYPNVKAFGFINHLSELIKQSDIVLTKAGPASILEAAIFRKPIIITSWIVQQEKDNIDYVLKAHLGLYCPKIEKLSQAIKKLYDNYDYYTSSEIGIKNGTQAISHLLLEKISQASL